METGEIHDKLNDLVHLDVDAVRAYDDAIRHIDDATVRGRLQEFRADHQRHVDDLRATIRGIGGEPEEPKPDFKGYLIEGMTALRSAMGEDQALKAMHQNEEVTNRHYRDALAWDVPTDIHDLLMRNYADEKRHLAFIDEHVGARAGTSTRPEDRY